MSGSTIVVMDELKSRRLDRLADQIVQQMVQLHHPSRSNKEPRIVIPVNADTVTDTRRAARLAGARLGWSVSTHIQGDELHIVNRRGLAVHPMTPNSDREL